MGVIVVAGATLKCTAGSGPGSLSVTSQNSLLVDGKPAATIKDTKASCGMCSSMKNPQVEAATSAAQGILSPQPCAAKMVGSWSVKQKKFLADGIPCLTNDSTARCAYGETISIKDPGQKKVKTS